MRSHPGARIAASLVIGVVALQAAPAAARTFGARLNRQPNSTATCGNSFPTAPGVTSCLGFATVPNFYAPFSGVVTRVRVRTGPFPTGPMQIVVLRSYYQNNPGDPGHPNLACCFVQRYGPIFRPRRNRTTVVKTSLGMVEQPTPPPGDGNTVAKDDFLTLSLLRGDVPFPLVRGTNGYRASSRPRRGAATRPPRARTRSAVARGPTRASRCR